MANIRDLRRRIKSIKNIQQITKAMKAVSAGRMRRAQDSVVAARPYAKRLIDVLGRVGSATRGVKHPLLEVREPNSVAIVVITADRGLCGGFNANVIRKAMQELKEHPNASLVCIGRKGRDFFRKRGYNIVQQYVGLGEAVSAGQAKEIGDYIIQKYSSGEFDVVYVVYSEFVNVLVQKPLSVKLLPAEPPKAEAGDDKKLVEYIYEPSAEEVMSALLPKYVVNTVFQGMLESKAGFYSAQMTAMDNATKNASEMITKLTLTMNRIRQDAITKEISEIVGGAAALE
ncbi:ATP synthase gamma chain [Desulfocucumis palustris]|uniref:ATP synthase gamma chain n=1 Tax=Desulfocucumis palustris TaxID=1898651 RepID=A0A2L2XMR7_9FIRM|nr:ATP synthase F1 subunit gamma [Desulfocucumis palustris]GBF35636.1 ATP synthase gamma chain [Desulfocucumis palustris]